MDEVNIKFVYPLFLRRYLSFLCDLSILSSFFLISSIGIQIFSDFTSDQFYGFIYFLFSSFLYFVLLPIYFKRTLGNIIFDINLVDDTGNVLNTSKIFLRNLIFFIFFAVPYCLIIFPIKIPYISFLHISFLPIILNVILIFSYFNSSKKQVFYDQLTGCQVIYRISKNNEVFTEYDPFKKIFFASIIDFVILIPVIASLHYLLTPILLDYYGCSGGFFFRCLGEAIIYLTIILFLVPILYFLILLRKGTFGEKIMKIERGSSYWKDSLRNFFVFYGIPEFILSLVTIYSFINLFITLILRNFQNQV